MAAQRTHRCRRRAAVIARKMTMDINNKKGEVQGVKGEEQTEISAKVVKRPFDVAFLMLPDEKLKQKQAKLGKLLNYGRQISVEEGAVYEGGEKVDTDEEIEVDGSPKHSNGRCYQKQQVFDDPKVKIPLNECPQKSAFTKVSV